MKKYISRAIENTVLEFTKGFPAIMITGPRQVGKTTLLNYISERELTKINYVTLDKISNRTLAIEDPELYANDNISLESYFENYIKTYIERDTRELINIKDEIKFMKFMVSVAARTGQELNLTEIANDVEMSVPTINEWLSILVNTGMVMLIEPYSTNVIKRVVKRPKLYFMDTGLASYLAKYPNPKVLESSAFSGAIFGTYVITEIIKSYSNKGINIKRDIYYYRNNNGCEIDLIIERNGKLYPIEIKKSKSPNKSAIKNFKVLDDLKKEVAPGIVLCMIDEIMPIDRNNYYVPITYI